MHPLRLGETRVEHRGGILIRYRGLQNNDTELRAEACYYSNNTLFVQIELKRVKDCPKVLEGQGLLDRDHQTLVC